MPSLPFPIQRSNEPFAGRDRSGTRHVQRDGQHRMRQRAEESHARRRRLTSVVPEDERRARLSGGIAQPAVVHARVVHGDAAELRSSDARAVAKERPPRRPRRR